MSHRLFGLLALTSLLLAACADEPLRRVDVTYAAAANSQFLQVNYKAADALILLAKNELAPEQPLIIATVVDINNLEKSSALGRTISEQISGQFTRRGYSMIEMKFRNSIYMKRNQGEMGLTREIADLATTYKARGVIVGSYSDTRDFVYINLKLIRPGDNVVVAAYDYTLPKDGNIQDLLTH